MRSNRATRIALGAAVCAGIAVSVSLVTQPAEAAETVPTDYQFVGGQTVGDIGDIRLVLQTDGNLVLYRGDQALAASDTVGISEPGIIMQGDGNLVLTSNGTVVAHSETFGHPGATLHVQADGNVVVYDPTGVPLAALFGSENPLKVLKPINTDPSAELAAQAAAIALQYQGKPYRYGGASASGFDCSGLVVMVYAQLGIALPHNSEAILYSPHTTEIPREAAVPGDVIWTPGHVAIYEGGNQEMAAHRPGVPSGVVNISSGNPKFLRVG